MKTVSIEPRIGGGAAATLARARQVTSLPLVGNARIFREAIAPIPVIARSARPVLIGGETGTGKELVARAIHAASDRANFPFVAVNCGSLVDTLVDDALFGHEQGAFTDARVKREGLIARAGGGTLFLDELEALSMKGQVTLLRVLEDDAFRALGSSRLERANVRFVAATNSPLESAIKTGGFRADLYYRLCVFAINLPPLRDRPEDILTLAHHFVREHAPPTRRCPTSTRARGARSSTINGPATSGSSRTRSSGRSTSGRRRSSRPTISGSRSTPRSRLRRPGVRFTR